MNTRMRFAEAIMTHNSSTYAIALVAALVVAGMAASAHATVTITGAGSYTETSDASQTAYSGDVSTSDLLHGLTGTYAGWKTNVGAPAKLNNGIHGGDNEGGEVAYADNGATAEYNLGTGANGVGYDITSIQTIAAWGSGNFWHQRWTLEVKPVGGSYTTVATAVYTPAGSTATKITLTGLDLSGIEFIRLTTNGQFTFREMDVFGVDSSGPATPGTLIYGK